jgi:arabinogalactan endo-1,4-beta-galactosidase
MLPEIEKAGGVFRTSDGTAGDAVALLHDDGCNLFRVRLFVSPATDFNKSYGATQDLQYVRAMAKRIKATGASFLLDIHYSDTWADPSHQTKPAAWQDLSFDALTQKVHDYTAQVLDELERDQAMPDMVQIGNEITGGILWPDGKVLDVPADRETEQWQRFATLLNAGARAVREKQSESHPIRIILHIHGGGKQGMTKWFFGKLSPYQFNYDIVGLSFYPAWNDLLDNLKQNVADAVTATGKDVIIAETSYPWKPLSELNGPAMRWPQTPQGQKQFLNDLKRILADLPEHRALGFIWWYPEAIPTQPLQIWRNGAEALFDEAGKPLPALTAFGAQ